MQVILQELSGQQYYYCNISYVYILAVALYIIEM